MDLSDGASRLFMALDEYARDKGSCFPSENELCRRLGISRRTLVRRVAELRDAGAVETSREGSVNGRNVYRLRHGCATVAPLEPNMAQPDEPNMAQPKPLLLITETRKGEAIPPTPQPKELTVSEFQEIANAFDRHLKHHRTEDRDNVLRVLMDLAQRGGFDWTRFRVRHGAWCDRQEQLGWQYASLTFLGWVRAGMPPPTPQATEGGKKQTGSERLVSLMKKRISEGRPPL